MSLTLNTDCKIEKIFFQDPNLTMSADQCREIKTLSATGEKELSAEIIRTMDQNQRHQLASYPAALAGIKDQCHDSSVMLGMLMNPKTETVNRRIASEPVERTQK